MTCEEAGCPTCCPTGRPLTRDELRAWLDRPCPPRREPEPEEPEAPEPERGAPFDEALPPTEPLELLQPSETRLHLHLLEGGVQLDERDWYEFQEASA